MLPNAIGLGGCGLGIWSSCCGSVGFGLLVVDFASFVIRLLGFLGSAAILDCDDTEAGLAADSCGVDDAVAEIVTKLLVGWMLLTLKASGSSTLTSGLEFD